MNVPSDTIKKMENLSEEKLGIIINLVDSLSLAPEDNFDALCKSGAKHPMTEEEVDELIKKVRVETNAVGN